MNNTIPSYQNSEWILSKFIRIVVSLEEEFECEMPDSKLLLTEMNTISKMTDVISAVVDNQNNSMGE